MCVCVHAGTCFDTGDKVGANSKEERSKRGLRA